LKFHRRGGGKRLSLKETGKNGGGLKGKKELQNDEQGAGRGNARLRGGAIPSATGNAKGKGGTTVIWDRRGSGEVKGQRVFTSREKSRMHVKNGSGHERKHGGGKIGRGAPLSNVEQVTGGRSPKAEKLHRTVQGGKKKL